MTSGDTLLLALVVTLNVVSIISSVVLLAMLRRPLRAVGKGRLLTQQLRYLAIADILFHLGSAGLVILDFGSVPDQVGGALCSPSLVLYRFGRLTSQLLELNICASFTVQSLRMRESPTVLRRILPWSFPVGMLLAYVEGSSTGIQWGHYDTETRKCWEMGKRSSDLVVAAVFSVTFAACVLAYLGTALRSAKSAPASVARRTWLRAAAYPFNFLVCNSWGLIVFLTSRAHDEVWFTLAFGFMALSGLLNYLTYAVLARQVRFRAPEIEGRSLQEVRTERPLSRDLLSWHVGFVSQDSMVPVSAPPSFSKAELDGTQPGQGHPHEMLAPVPAGLHVTPA